MLEQIRKAVADPALAANVLNVRARETVGAKLNKYRGQRVLEADWDTLILLDGCRYDIFEQTVPFEGDLQSFRSAGSASYEYFLNKYDGGRYPDVAYISANTWFHKIQAEFADIVPARELLWDDELTTVSPYDLTEYVLDHQSEYADKRLVVHYMQPHMPFLTRQNGSLQKHPVSSNEGIYKFSDDPDPDTTAWWDRLERGQMDRDVIWSAYRETLEIAFDAIEPLLELPGRSVVSADHGNAFGDGGIYGHPNHRAHESLVRVPWFIVENGRKEITPATRLTSTRELSAVDEDKLKALGYVQ